MIFRERSERSINHAPNRGLGYQKRLLGAGLLAAGIARVTNPSSVDAATNCAWVALDFTHQYYIDNGGEKSPSGGPKYTDPKKDPTSRDEIVAPAKNRQWKIYNPTTGRSIKLKTGNNGSALARFRDIPTDSVQAGDPAVDLRIRKIKDDPTDLNIGNGQVLTDCVSEGANPSNLKCQTTLPVQYFSVVTSEQAAILKPQNVQPVATPAETELKKTTEPNESKSTSTPVPMVPSPTIRVNSTATANTIAVIEQNNALKAENARLQTRVATLQTVPPTQTPSAQSAANTVTPISGSPDTKPNLVPTATAVKTASGANPLCQISSIGAKRYWITDSESTEIYVSTNDACIGQKMTVSLVELDPFFPNPADQIETIVEGTTTQVNWDSKFNFEPLEGGTQEFRVEASIGNRFKRSDRNIEVTQPWYPLGYLPNLLGAVIEVASAAGLTWVVDRIFGRPLEKTFKWAKGKVVGGGHGGGHGAGHH